MRTSIGLIALSATCLLASCATAYQPDGVSGGYTDKVLAGNTVQVSFRGNRMTTRETLHSYLLRRCAELTLQDGYDHFVLVHEEEPNEATTNAFGSKVSTATIQMYAGKPQGEARAYDASSLLRQILAQQGESDEPPPVAVADTNQVIPPPIPGAAHPSNNVANGPGASPVLVANPNPNALTNDPVHFDHW